MLELGHPWSLPIALPKAGRRSRGTVATLVNGAGDFVATALLDPHDRIVARILARKR